VQGGDRGEGEGGKKAERSSRIGEAEKGETQCPGRDMGEGL